MECAGHLLISFVCLVVGRGRGQGKWASRDISCPCFADENQLTAKNKTQDWLHVTTMIILKT